MCFTSLPLLPRLSLFSASFLSSIRPLLLFQQCFVCVFLHFPRCISLIGALPVEAFGSCSFLVFLALSGEWIFIGIWIVFVLGFFWRFMESEFSLACFIG